MAHEPAGKAPTQPAGRKATGAHPPDPSKTQAGSERYPPVEKDDSVDYMPGPAGEARTFAAPPQPRQDADEASLPPAESRLGPRGDPAEGKR